MEGDKHNYIEMLAEMEHDWQSAVEKAMCVREDQLTTAHRAIQDLRHRTQQQDSQLRTVSREMTTLRTTVADLTAQLDAAQKETARVKEQNQKIMEERNCRHAEEVESIKDKLELTNRELDSKQKELHELRTVHENAQEMENQSRISLRELQNQLNMAKNMEAIHKARIDELENKNADQAKRLIDWNRVSEKMCYELGAMKNKLMGSRYANSQLKQELQLWKRYCESVEEEKKAMGREHYLHKRVMQTFGQVESYLKSERKHRDMSVDALNNLGKNILNEFKNQSKPTRLVTVECQTENCQHVENDTPGKKDTVIELFRLKIIEMEDELKKAHLDVNNLTQQNATLRDVIKSMRKEREEMEKEKEHIEEEARVEKLEESMKILKRSLLSDQKDICVWTALQEVKKEVANLKIKSLANNKGTSDKSKPFFPDNQQSFIIKPLGHK